MEFLLAAAFSQASDLGLGQPIKHVLGAWRLAAHLPMIGFMPRQVGAGNPSATVVGLSLGQRMSPTLALNRLDRGRRDQAAPWPDAPAPPWLCQSEREQ